MDPDDLIIRAAGPDEAETLSHLAFRAQAYWEYPKERMDAWLEAGAFTISPDEIEANPTYVVEDEEEMEILGFYSFEIEDDLCRLKTLSVLPEHIGAGIRTTLFLHACEFAETLGALTMLITPYPHEIGFYEEMGARQAGEPSASSEPEDRTLPVFRLNL